MSWSGRQEVKELKMRPNIRWKVRRKRGQTKGEELRGQKEVKWWIRLGSHMGQATSQEMEVGFRAQAEGQDLITEEAKIKKQWGRQLRPEPGRKGAGQAILIGVWMESKHGGCGSRWWGPGQKLEQSQGASNGLWGLNKGQGPQESRQVAGWRWVSGWEEE